MHVLVVSCAGNLLVLADGRVGFIDFGIVGRISPVTFKAMESLIASVAVSVTSSLWVWPK